MFLETYLANRQHLEDEKTEGQLKSAKAHLSNALAETRRIISNLRPALLDDLGLVDALRSSLAQLVADSGVRWELTVDLGDENLDADTEIVLYRVAQEAVGNALRHAQTDRVLVDLRSGPAGTELTIQDWGTGFDTTEPLRDRDRPGLGLIGMRERAELLDGTFELESIPGSGTTVRVRIPHRHGHADGEYGA